MRLKIKNFIVSCLLVFAISSCAQTASNPSEQFVQRILPAHYDMFEIVTQESESKNDFFQVEAKNGKIVITGNNGVSHGAGLNFYLEKYCNAQMSLNGILSPIPEVLPLPTEVERVETPFEHRYIFNYCTYGYSMPWWDWERWEEMIDYMALKGVNMPLATIGQEAVWKEVYTELGLSQAQLDDFFVGPAHLPWGWMGNIDGLGGPLPNSWIEKRAELQVKVLERMRSLGMKPVLQAFTGHVPKALTELFPEANVTQIEDWAGIEGTMFLDPGDPLFEKIGKMFIDKQTEMFGTDHFYDADCFIEVDPPSNDPEYLSRISSTIYNSMAAADPEATWVLQGWFLFFKKDFWQTPQANAFFTGIPKDKVLVLDLYGEKNPVWDKTESFFGQPWIWNVICNEDQKVNMSGDLNAMQEEFNRAYTQEMSNNLRGIGIIPEGVGYNDVVYDFIFNKAWDQNSMPISTWIADWAERRYGVKNQEVREVWTLLSETVYGRTRTMWSPLLTTPRLKELGGSKDDIRHNRVDFKITSETDFAWDFDVYQLAEAADMLLNLSDELGDNENYRFDLVNVYRELIHAMTHVNINNISKAYADKDLDALYKATDAILKQLDDMEAILAADDRFMLGEWLEDAKSWGDTPELQKYYERNARTIVTIWQPIENGSLRDYASKQWSGLMQDYHRPRWALFCNMLKESLEQNKPFSMSDFEKQVRAMDFKWTKSNNPYPAKATNDAVEVAKRLRSDYEFLFN